MLDSFLRNPYVELIVVVGIGSACLYTGTTQIYKYITQCLEKKRDALVRERDVLVRERDASVRERDVLVRERDASVQERNVLVRERDASVQERNAHVQEKAAYSNAIIECDQNIEKAKRKLFFLERERDRTRERPIKNERKIEEMQIEEQSQEPIKMHTSDNVLKEFSIKVGLIKPQSRCVLIF